MRKRLILGFIFVTINLLYSPGALAQKNESTQATNDSIHALADKAKLLSTTPSHIPLLAGMSVSTDVVGLACRAFSSYGQYEGAFRINLKERFFPICELGIGSCDKTDDATELHYKTTAPYIRIGCDYNFLKDKTSGNRLFAGFRIAYTSFKFDLDGPDQQDPVWGDQVPYHFKDLKSSCTWGELVGGLEAKIWGIFHLGWTVRCRFRAAQKKPHVGGAWYVPGYGRNGSSRLGATFNLIFDI